MSGHPEIYWSNDAERGVFSHAGLSDAGQFLDIENSGSEVQYKHVSRHQCSKGDRSMTCIRINKVRYYLRRASGAYFRMLANEFEALKIIPEFGITPPKILAWMFDDKDSKGFILYKNLSGFHSLKSLVGRTAPPEAVADFQTRKKEIIVRLVKIAKRIKDAGYYYPDWRGRHVFIRTQGDEITLIDFTRFVLFRSLPWQYRLPAVRNMLRRQEWKKFRRCLKSRKYTTSFLKKLVKEDEKAKK